MNYQTFPKIALHDHLDGGLRPETLVELAAAANVALPSTDPQTLARLIAEKADSKSLPGYLETFGWTVGVMQTRDNLIRVAREAVLDLAADGVVLAELRFGPLLCTAQGLSVDAVIEAVTTGLQEGRHATGNRIEVGLILCGLRHLDEFSVIREAFLRHYNQLNSFVVGVDLAGPELGFPPSGHPALGQLAHEFPAAPITLHAGEADGLPSIKDALQHGAKRLGHGVRLEDSLQGISPEIVAHVRNAGIVIEACLSSNVHTGAVPSLAAHPIRRLFDYGITVIPCTDNRLMSATTHSQELQLMCETFGFTEEECIALMRRGLQRSFLAPAAVASALRHW